MSSTPLSVTLDSLTEPLVERIGAPTCGPGCSRCCERMTVLMSSAEALLIARTAQDWAPAWRTRMKELKKWIEKNDAPEEARDALLDQGPCVFLVNQRCGVYEVRPDSCRACLVWHEPWFCGRTDWDMTTPADLNAARIENIYGRMLAEHDAGRKPFWGYVLPAVWAADRYAAEYEAGADLSRQISARWVETELIEFPSRKRLEQELRDHREIFRKNRRPFNQPLIADVQDREDLAPRSAT